MRGHQELSLIDPFGEQGQPRPIPRQESSGARHCVPRKTNTRGIHIEKINGPFPWLAYASACTLSLSVLTRPKV